MVMPIGVALQDMCLLKTLLLVFTFPFKKVSHAFSFLMNKIRLTMSTSLKLELLESTARWGFPFIFEWLYDDLDEKNPKIYCRLSEKTLLHLAAENGHYNICKKIIESVQNKNPPDELYWTPLHLAAFYGHLKVCEYILENIDEKNPKGYYTLEVDVTPLDLAAQNGHLAVYQCISKSVGAVNPADSTTGATPLHFAASAGHFTVCKYILQNTMNKDPIDAMDGLTPFDVADYEDHSKICELIAKERGDKDYQHRSDKVHFLNRQIQNHLKNFSNLIKSSPLATCNAVGVTYPLLQFQIFEILDSLFGYPITKSLNALGYKMTSGSVATFTVINPVNVMGYEEWNQFRKSILCEDSRKVEVTCINEPWFFTKSTNRIESTLAKSIQAAYSYAKIFVKKIDPSNSFLTEEINLNLTVVYLNSGMSNPGQGSSAGCVIASCFISFALQKPIKKYLVMTGTISPEGKIGSIGGVFGKVCGSIKAGMKKIILPKENQADFETLPAKIKDSITVHYAETFHDIYKIAFESKSFSECCITISRKNEVEEPQLSRIECRRNPMLMTDDILDAIQNKKYSVRKVEPPNKGPLKILTVDNQPFSNQMLARLINRVRMGYSDSEENEDENDMFHNFKPRL